MSKLQGYSDDYIINGDYNTMSEMEYNRRGFLSYQVSEHLIKFQYHSMSNNFKKGCDNTLTYNYLILRQ